MPLRIDDLQRLGGDQLGHRDLALAELAAGGHVGGAIPSGARRPCSLHVRQHVDHLEVVDRLVELDAFVRVFQRIAHGLLRVAHVSGGGDGDAFSSGDR